MPCAEMMELKANTERLNDLSVMNMSILSSGREEFSKWHRAGRARLAYTMQMHRQSCPECSKESSDS
jgi:hypothetical protein